MISKTEKIIISKASREIKKAIRNLVADNDFLEDFISLDDYCGSCGIASLAMYHRLNQFGIDCNWSYGYHLHQQPEYGERHCWVDLKNKIVDVTYKQISDISNNIYISPINYVKLKQNPTHRVFNRNWKWQNPYRYSYDWQDEKLKIVIK